jgi:hypothetical protein
MQLMLHGKVCKHIKVLLVLQQFLIKALVHLLEKVHHLDMDWANHQDPVNLEEVEYELWSY